MQPGRGTDGKPPALLPQAYLYPLGCGQERALLLVTQCCVVPVPYREIEEALTHPVLRRKERVQKILWRWVVLPNQG